MVSAKASCHNIMCEFILGSPPPFLFFVRARGEPGNEATELLNTNLQFHLFPTVDYHYMPPGF